MPIMNSGRWSDHLGRIGRAREETENRDAFISQARGNALKVSDQVSDPGYQSGIRENKRKHERTLAREKSVMDLENEKTLRSLPSATDLSRERLGREGITSREKISREGITSRENIARIGSSRMSSRDRESFDKNNTEHFMAKYKLSKYKNEMLSDSFNDDQMNIMKNEAAEKGLKVYFDKDESGWKVKNIVPNINRTGLGQIETPQGTPNRTKLNNTTDNPIYGYRDERGKVFSTTNKDSIPEKYMKGVRVYQSGSSANSGQLLSELPNDERMKNTNVGNFEQKDYDFLKNNENKNNLPKNEQALGNNEQALGNNDSSFLRDLYKSKAGKLGYKPVWDFANSFNQAGRTTWNALNQAGEYMYNEGIKPLWKYGMSEAK